MDKEEKKPELFRFRGQGVLSGEFDKLISLDEVRGEAPPIIEAWLADPDIMEITLVSPNIGFVYTFTKPRPGWTLPE